jgi:hypothetical protein
MRRSGFIIELAHTPALTPFAQAVANQLGLKCVHTMPITSQATQSLDYLQGNCFRPVSRICCGCENALGRHGHRSMEAVMNDVNALVQRYFAVWNETDTDRRRELIAQTWADDATYIDPMMRGDGHAGIDAMIQGVQSQFAGHRFRQIGVVDAHNGHARFAWELAPADGPVLVAGTDFAAVTDDNRLQRVIGFLDLTPAAMPE